MTADMIVFDCDGVLVDSEVLSVAGMVSALNAAGVPATAPMVARFYGMKQADILLKISEETGRDIGTEVGPTIWPATRALFDTALQPMPGLADFVARHAEVARCVASSSSLERIRHSLGLTGLLPLFGEAIFSSQQVARGKPAPDLFLFAAARMDVDPARCIVVEDSPYGVRGAVAAGMRAIGFVGGSHIQGHHAALLAEAGAAHVERDWTGVERRIFG